MVSRTLDCGTAATAKQAALGILVAGAVCMATVLGVVELAASRIKSPAVHFQQNSVVNSFNRGRRDVDEDGAGHNDGASVFDPLPDSFG